MSYEVRLTHKAEQQLNAAVDWWAEHRSPEQAERWHAGVVNAMLSLGVNPLRCRLARENRAAPIELRELQYGLGRRTSHRILFAVRQDRIVVYAIRHVAQDDLTVDDL